MPTPPGTSPRGDRETFFSYSREDGEFVLKLASELRAEGVNLWLDQLDIPAGERWDRAVENALESCQTMVVVLSPSSVDSVNVMDEVSFALESGKKVVPVLSRACDIPFRLRRVQYISFVEDYDRGLERLVRALRGRAEDAAASPAPDQPSARADRPEDHAPEDSGGRFWKRVGVGLAALALLVVAFVLAPRFAPKTDEGHRPKAPRNRRRTKGVGRRTPKNRRPEPRSSSSPRSWPARSFGRKTSLGWEFARSRRLRPLITARTRYR